MAAAAFQDCKIEGLCNINLHTRSHHCPHELSGACVGGGNVYINGKQAQRDDDEVEFKGCKHGGSGRQVKASHSVYFNGQGAARLGDEIACDVCPEVIKIAEGSENVFIGD